MSKKMVAVSIVVIFFAIIGFDVWLYLDNVEGNSISQVIIWATDASPLVPFAIGVLMGGLAIHWFESYFERDADRNVRSGRARSGDEGWGAGSSSGSA